MRDIEHKHQVALFKWLEWACKFDIRLKYIFAVPNGGKRSIGLAVKLKAEGVKRGVPDIVIPFPSKGFHGAYIEMKAPEDKINKIKAGKIKDQQYEYLDFLTSQGYLTTVCYTWSDAKTFIEDYINE